MNWRGKTLKKMTNDELAQIYRFTAGREPNYGSRKNQLIGEIVAASTQTQTHRGKIKAIHIFALLIAMLVLYLIVNNGETVVSILSWKIAIGKLDLMMISIMNVMIFAFFFFPAILIHGFNYLSKNVIHRAIVVDYWKALFISITVMAWLIGGLILPDAAATYSNKPFDFTIQLIVYVSSMLLGTTILIRNLKKIF